MDRHLPKNFIGLRVRNLEMSCVCTLGLCIFSYKIGLSPILFANYIDVLIIRLKASGYVCQLMGEYFGCLLYMPIA